MGFATGLQGSGQMELVGAEVAVDRESSFPESSGAKDEKSQVLINISDILCQNRSECSTEK